MGRWAGVTKGVRPWNTVWQWFDRLSKAGMFEAFFGTLAVMNPTAHLIQMFDSTIVRAHVSTSGQTSPRALLSQTRAFPAERGGLQQGRAA